MKPVKKKKRKIIKPEITKTRIMALNLGVVILLLGLVLRLGYIMVFQKAELTAKATEQWTNEVQIDAKRGRILDRDGRELAISANVYRVDLDLITIRNTYFNTKDDKNKIDSREMSSKIADAIGMPQEDVLNKLESKLKSGAPASSVILARRIESEQATKVKELKIMGIIVSPDTKRYYTNDNFLSHVLGSTSIDGKGVSGIELQYNKELSGVPGIRIAQTDRISRESPYSTPLIAPADNGKDVVLTINEKIQFAAEKAATKAIVDNDAKSATVIVTNPKNGEILAMTNKPDYNPNKPYEGADKFKGTNDGEKVSNMWSDWAVSHAFEPGSTFKILTAYAALEEGLVTDSDRFYCPGYHMVNGVRINCWKEGGHGTQDLQGILNNSCNPGFMKLGEKIGKEKMDEYMRRFGLGKLSGVDLPGETPGILRPVDKINAVDLASISFGQTDSVNAVQLMAAVNAVANGGTLVQPHVMKEISHLDKDGKTVVDRVFEPTKTTVAKPEVAANLRKYLENVVTKGSANKTYIEGYNIAGKTGTAEKPAAGGYGQKYVASFVGMAPSEDPNISVMIIIDEPVKNGHFAGIIVTPLAKELFTDIFNAYDPRIPQ